MCDNGNISLNWKVILLIWDVFQMVPWRCYMCKAFLREGGGGTLDDFNRGESHRRQRQFWRDVLTLEEIMM